MDGAGDRPKQKKGASATYAVSESLNMPGLQAQNCFAKTSIMRSIFCDSPGSRKLHRYARSESRKGWSLKSCSSEKAASTWGRRVG